MRNIIFGTLLVLAGMQSAHPADFSFTLHKLQSENPGPTLLIIGGIQGDEPGGFTAASLLVTNYKITRGEVWVVPNLNFESIIKQSRGIYGDMNRKFLTISSSDPDYQAVMKIKRIIVDKQVDMILNLHDGSGYYNPAYIDKDENPQRWGQSIVIDQKSVATGRIRHLQHIAQQATRSANVLMNSSRQKFYLRNTRTRDGDLEMKQTLTYFAIRNGKAAIAIEASKSDSTSQRVYSHLVFIEAMLARMGIDYKRNFQLTADSINHKLGRDIRLTLFDNKILYDFDTARKRIHNVPIKKESAIEFEANNPLVAIVKSAQGIHVRYGNRGVTTLSPIYHEYDYSLHEVRIVIDGVEEKVHLGTVVKVGKNFKIQPIRGRRVNIIGFKKAGQINESGLLIHREALRPRLSVDKQAEKYRVEFYKKEKYSGMILIDFSDQSRIKSAGKVSSHPG